MSRGSRTGARRRPATTAALGAVAAVLALWPAASLAQDASRSVLFSSIEGEVVTPVLAAFLLDGVDRAVDEGHQAYLVELDSPGGLDRSMRDVIKAFLNARVPVIVYVPPGGRAASAGALIGFSAHVLAMAPGTSIGAATPVDLQGGDISRKIVNDAAAFAESVARARGRDTTFAIESVRTGRSASAEEAERIGVVDELAPNREALLESLDGHEIELLAGRQVTLRTTGTVLAEHEMGFVQRAQQRLADPNLAFIFLSIGTLAIIYELATPGIGAGGIVGVILVLLALFSLSVLPVNTAGALLMVLAAILFVAEVLAPGIGVFAAGGAASLVLGGLLLFRGSVDVSLGLVLPTAVVVGGLVVVAGRLAWRARRAPSQTGTGFAAGRVVTVRRADGPEGQAFLDGAWWRLRSRDGEPLEAGGRVRVVEVDGLELVVEAERQVEVAHPEEG